MDSVELNLSLRIDSLEENLKISNKSLSSQIKSFGQNLTSNIELIAPQLECIRCHENYSSLENSKCHYHDGFFKRFKSVGSKLLPDQVNLYSYVYMIWTCCEEENNYYYKLKPGHSRDSNKDLIKDDNKNYVPDHSTGCKEHDHHESNKQNN